VTFGVILLGESQILQPLAAHQDVTVKAKVEKPFNPLQSMNSFEEIFPTNSQHKGVAMICSHP